MFPTFRRACRLEVGDTAGWETCATRTVSRCTREHLAQRGDETLPVLVIQKNQLPPVTALKHRVHPVRACLKKERGCVEDQPQHGENTPVRRNLRTRSEERRVGKEGRS